MKIIEKSELSELIEAIYVEAYKLNLKFDDGLEKEINFKPFIGKDISMQLLDPDYFKKYKIEGGALTWPNGYDFCPMFLRENNA